MWAAVIGVPAGNPVTSTLKSAVAAVIAPPASLVRFSVIVAVPRPLFSAFVTAGTSFEGNSVAVNFTVVGLVVEGVVGVFEPQPAARIVRPATRIDKRVIVFSLIEFTSQVESEEQALWGTTLSNLKKRRF